MLTPKKRSALFLITFIAFIILSIATLFYSLGYSIGPGLQIQKTGGLFVKTNEYGALISVDGKKQKTTSILGHSALIKNVAPGMHFVEINKNGFIKWQKFINVKPEIVSSRDAILVPVSITNISLGTATPDNIVTYAIKNNALLETKAGASITLFDGVKKFWRLPRSGGFLMLGEDKYFYHNASKLDLATSSPKSFLGVPYNFAQIISSLLSTKNNSIFSDDEMRIIYWDDHTIGSYWFGEEDKLPQWQKTRELQILTIPAKIRNVVSYPQHNDYIIIEVGGYVWIINIEPYGGQDVIPIYNGEEPRIIDKSDEALIIKDKGEFFKLELP